MVQKTNPDAAAAALRLHIEAGVDEVLLDAPQVRWQQAASRESDGAAAQAVAPLAQAKQRPAPRSPLRSTAGQSLSPSPAAQPEFFPAPKPFLPAQDASLALRDAESAASAAQSLDALVAAIEAFEGCELKEQAKNTVVYDGVSDAQILLIGEAPGVQEDALGKPFVGVSGQLLDRMLAAIGLSRQRNVLISNSVFWRPLANRKPSDGDVALCLPFVKRLIELLAPKVILFVGGVALKGLTGVSGITRQRGNWQEVKIAGRDIPALPIFHPAYLLRQPSHKRETWRDLLALQAKLEALDVPLD
jgi:DNA polymerase